MTGGVSARAGVPLLAAPLVGAGALAILVTGALVATGSEMAWAVPGLVFALLTVAIWRPGALTTLGIVLGLQVFQLGGEEGLSAGEALAGLALVGYVVGWYAVTWAAGRHVVLSLFDVAAVTWGVGGLLVAALLGPVFGADAYDYRADIIATLPFLLYLPVKDACVRHSRGPIVVASAIALLGLVATVQNGLMFRAVITGASEWWQIADARFSVGETSMTAGTLLSLAGVATVRSRRARLALIVTTGIFLGGLVLTKSRGFWVSNAFGILVMLLVAPPAARRRIGVYGTAGIGLLVVFALTFFGDQLTLIVVGTVNRLLSLMGAGSDVSLLNRFAESAAAWERIRANPILGYGWGVQVTHYSVIGQGTRHWAFLHNGYLAIWLKTGLWGLGLVMTVWFGALVRGARAARTPGLSTTYRAAGLGCAAVIAAFTPVAGSSNPFSVLDQMLVVTLVLALGHGVGDRARAVRNRSATEREAIDL